MLKERPTIVPPSNTFNWLLIGRRLLQLYKFLAIYSKFLRMTRPICIVSGIFPPDSGGPARFTYEFSNWLQGSGKEVSIISYTDHARVLLHQSRLEVCLISRTSPLILRYFRFLKAVHRYKKLGYNFFAVGAFIEIFLAKIFLGINYTAKVPGDIVWERARNKKETQLGIVKFQTSKKLFKYRIFRKLYSFSLRAATNVIVPSRGLLELCNYWGVQNKKINLVYNSIDNQEFDVVANSMPRYDVLTVCRLAPWKGVAELLTLASELQFSLLIAGDGPEREKLEHLAKSLNSKAVFLGNVSRDLMPFVYKDARVFVLNSEYEGLPHALIEARAAGCLTIAKAGTGSEEVIHHGVDGFLVNSHLELKTLLQGILRPDEDLTNYRVLAKEDTLARFNQDKNFPAILNVLEPV